MLTLVGGQVECLWDEVLPVAARELPEDLARMDRVLCDPALSEPGLKITDRLVSLADPDARPIRKGKLGKPTEFGYVAQICEVTENTRKGARGFILPAGHAPGNPSENRLLAHTAIELDRAGIKLPGDRRRRRLLAKPDQRSVPRNDRRADTALGAPRARFSQDPQAPRSLPHRHRGPHQPPQARLRTTPITTEGP